MTNVILRPMNDDDWPSVCRIYEEGLAGGNASFETTAPSWQNWNAAHCPHSRLVACQAGVVVGWAALSPTSSRSCYAGVAEVSVYVAANCRGQSVGSQLMTALITSSEANGIWTLCSGTFPENKASLKLQQSAGFRIIGTREKVARHHGIWRDTVLSERRSKVVGVAP
jgi:phosphinothricin acetyltransferase